MQPETDYAVLHCILRSHHLQEVALWSPVQRLYRQYKVSTVKSRVPWLNVSQLLIAEE